jgi:hypothetical protein
MYNVTCYFCYSKVLTRPLDIALSTDTTPYRLSVSTYSYIANITVELVSAIQVKMCLYFTCMVLFIQLYKIYGFDLP